MSTAVPTQMRAARCLAYNSSPLLSIVDTPTPQPKPHEVLIKVTAASLCHTDVGMALGHKQNEGSQCPMTAGHEPCGVVAALGADVTGFELGERVGFVNHAGACGTCQECSADRPIYCLDPHTKLRGVNTDGCFSEYAVGDARFTFKIPSALTDAQAAPLMCAGITAYAALDSLKLQKGDWLAVVGCGGLGHLLIQFAKAKGIQVLAVDVRQSSLDLATRVGASETWLSKGNKPPQDLLDRLEGGAHAAVLLAESQTAVEGAAEVVRKHGTVCCVAAPPDPWKISPLYLIHKDIHFTGTLLGNPSQCQAMLDLVAEHKIHIETKTFRFEQVNEMIDEALAGKADGRLVMTF